MSNKHRLIIIGSSNHDEIISALERVFSGYHYGNGQQVPRSFALGFFTAVVAETDGGFATPEEQDRSIGNYMLGQQN